MKTAAKTFRGPDGVVWRVTVNLPGSSNAMVIFRHPNGASSRLDRYNWFLSHGPESRSVTAHLSPAKVLESINDEELTRLFRRSMPVSRPDSIAAAQASEG